MSARFFFGGRYGFGGSNEAGIWWIRFADRLLQCKAPRYEPLFSERYGFYYFRVSWGGWRLLGKQKRG